MVKMATPEEHKNGPKRIQLGSPFNRNLLLLMKPGPGEAKEDFTKRVLEQMQAKGSFKQPVKPQPKLGE